MVEAGTNAGMKLEEDTMLDCFHLETVADRARWLLVWSDPSKDFPSDDELRKIWSNVRSDADIVLGRRANSSIVISLPSDVTPQDRARFIRRVECRAVERDGA